MSVITVCSSCRNPVGADDRFCRTCGIGTSEPRVVAPRRSRSRAAIGVAVAVALVTGGVVSHLRAPDPNPGRRIVAQMQVGPAGGTVPFENGGKVEIPAGALEKPREIVVYRTIVERETALTPRGATAAVVFPAGTLAVYTFGPFELDFLQPVTIAIPVPAGLVGQVFVFANGQFRFVTGQVVGDTVVIQVRGFGNGFLLLA